jgi:two-component system cell cycle sensor histidine kinase/response regulator CckA
VLHPERFNPRAHTGFFVTVRVSDTGCGILPENLDKIFDPFFTTKGESEGTGLGLSMVYGIMQNHSGWVEVESTPGEGTSFTLAFPQVATPVENPIRELAPTRAPTRAGGHILVVDDEVQLVDLARQFLATVGLEVTGFSDPQAALEWYRKEWQNIDIVILDMKMPKVDGPTCFREIRRVNPGARVVIMSGFVQDSAAQELMEGGVAHFFEKPLRYPELVAWVVGALENRKKIAV